MNTNQILSILMGGTFGIGQIAMLFMTIAHAGKLKHHFGLINALVLAACTLWIVSAFAF